MPLQLHHIFDLSVFLVVIFIARLIRRYRPCFPPGPRGYPIIGNIYDIPSKEQWVTYRDMSKKYGSDIIYFNLSGTPMIVVNSLKAATELFDKRSSNYSDRPRFTMVCELVGMSWNFGLMPYGDSWRVRRKTVRQELNPRTLVQYRSSMISSTQKLLLSLLNKPDDFMTHLRYTAGTTILSIAYGIPVQPKNDPFIDIAEQAMYAVACTLNSGSYLVDQIPILKYLPDWFPGAGFKVQAKEWSKPVTVMPILTFDFVKDAMAKGNFASSLASRALERKSVSKLEADLNQSELSSSTSDETSDEKVLQDALAAMYAAGADTTVSTLGSFILALLKSPDVQRKGQMAVDEITGGERFPDFSDSGSIPYVEAILRETLRWHPVTPLSVPHKSVKDDEYNGYYIPGGSTVVGNGWAILHDESVYGPNPHLFNPDRFLKEDGTLDPNIPFPDPAFGFGRRLCAGKDLAVSSVWIAMAYILACFDITQAVDEDGNLIDPGEEYTSGFLCHPLPFKCSIKPRSQKAEEMIRSSLRDF